MGGRIAAWAVLGLLACGPASAQAVRSGDYVLPKDGAAVRPTLRLGPADGAAAGGPIDFSAGVPAAPLAGETARRPGMSMTFSAPTPLGGTASLSLTVRSGEAAQPRPGSRMSLLSGD
jgi:hypothetical protein